MKKIFSRTLILICFLIAFSKSKTLENNITEEHVNDVKQISLIEIKSERARAGSGRCGYNDWVDTPDYLGSRLSIFEPNHLYLCCNIPCKSSKQTRNIHLNHQYHYTVEIAAK